MELPKRKYSKAFDFYLGTKSGFFSDNDALLGKINSQNQIYREQPRREGCKLCACQLPEKPDLNSFGIDYVLCEKCGHLNGVYQDSEDFFRRIYLEDVNYSEQYTGDGFDRRTSDIYSPKVEFLAAHLDVPAWSILDVGCGSGFFVYACLKSGRRAAGIDISPAAVAYGNEQIFARTGNKPLKQVTEMDFFQAIVDSKSDVLSAIGVIEHLRQPQSFFNAFQESNIQYLLYSVPMFSPSVLIENVFPDVYPRHLSADHTHLFSESSIAWLHQDRKWQSVAEWRFGTDIMDLFRSIQVALVKSGTSEKMLKIFAENFAGGIGDMQSVLDHRHFCSEIHCLVKKV